ncbi:arsenate reductase (glutaredoxin) [Alteromonas oceanisediminis]|uniref:arsenate reductase (glutaredoxin) n=1 Tax=Alteromonas oceanisediminis TaxID=2836180 RepID=UPI001BDA44F7|nr:arsenate reductase (glutaredoxin) [Alteromonas oceanisediminis]MBT0586370.1 arsenate reductase (glutaredoxin) [Alteromonas oceanisediminis]
MQYLHNPRCSKSRQGLELLAANGVHPDIVLYLKEPLSEAQLTHLVSALGITDVTQMMRTKEPEFTALGLQGASNEKLIRAMAQTPKLIERPILIDGDKAVIGRPPEQLLSLVQVNRS